MVLVKYEQVKLATKFSATTADIYRGGVVEKEPG